MESCKVYLQKNFAPDKMLGTVNEKGDVYREDLGFNDRIGHVDFNNGKVYRRRNAAPDVLLGHVDVDNGEIHLEVPMRPDKYVGSVTTKGHLHLHLAGQPDVKIGSVKKMESLVQGGAAFLLLVLPAFEQKNP